ncbi:MAG: 50S ribosomal protein L30 [Nitrospiraceae bacterium]|nr:50S ribosomal protein L30 [Nitrospiraceae bacterium]
MLKITLKRGYIGIPDSQKKVLASFGFKKIGSTVLKKDDEATKGMIRKVAHLIAVEKVDNK